jgi:hypothetical protein
MTSHQKIADDLESLVHRSLDAFYERRFQALSALKLKETLKKKNPYLYRAIGIEKASELVEKLLQAFMSSSEETIFGDAFFEPIVKGVCNGVAATGQGVDVVVETEDAYTVISVKSGPNWGNSSQMVKQQQDFQKAYNVFQNKKLKKHFRALLGHCYGTKYSEPSGKQTYSVRSGQAFWRELTGDPDFYLTLIRLMENYPKQHRLRYEAEWIKAVNRFTGEFITEFCAEDGAIDWEKLAAFNSGEKTGRSSNKP